MGRGGAAGCGLAHVRSNCWLLLLGSGVGKLDEVIPRTSLARLAVEQPKLDWLEVPTKLTGTRCLPREIVHSADAVSESALPTHDLRAEVGELPPVVLEDDGTETADREADIRRLRASIPEVQEDLFGDVRGIHEPPREELRARPLADGPVVRAENIYQLARDGPVELRLLLARAGKLETLLRRPVVIVDHLADLRRRLDTAHLLHPPFLPVIRRGEAGHEYDGKNKNQTKSPPHHCLILLFWGWVYEETTQPLFGNIIPFLIKRVNGPTENRTPTSSMPWMRSTTEL